jgi:predicted nucleotidyltransferase
LLLAFCTAHTLNLLLNGQIWVVLKHYGLVRHTREQFEEVLEKLGARVSREPSIVYAAAYGSLARGEWDETSDLDVRLVRAPGWRAAWRVCSFAMRERARAFLRGFPLDMFVLDGYTSLDMLAEKNQPMVLGGTGAQIDQGSIGIESE